MTIFEKKQKEIEEKKKTEEDQTNKQESKPTITDTEE